MARRVEKPCSPSDVMQFAYGDCGLDIRHLVPYFKSRDDETMAMWHDVLTKFLHIRYGDDYTLELGPGKKPVKEAGIDLTPEASPTADLWWDLNKGIPLASESVSAIYSMQTLEHLRRERQIFIWNEMWRVLKPGGTMDHSMPHYLAPAMWGDPTHRTPYSETSAQYYCINPHTKRPFVEEFSDYGIECRFLVKLNHTTIGVEVHMILEKPEDA